MAPSRLILGAATPSRGQVFDPLSLSITVISSQSFPCNKRCRTHTFPAPTLPAFCISSRSLVIGSSSRSLVIGSLNFRRAALQTPPVKARRSDICPYGHRLLCRALRTSGETEIESNDGSNPSLLQRPAYVPKQGMVKGADLDGSLQYDRKDDNENDAAGSEEVRSGAQWIDWEDEILQDTRPLVGFARMILHSNRYQNGKRLSPEDEKVILDKLLPYHPNIEEKIGCGVDFIMVDNHPEFETTRCLFITRKDGSSVDFSFWKCVKGFIWKKYPQFAESFIQKHFRRRA